MKKYTGHLLALVALMAAANVAWAQEPQAAHAAPAAPTAPAVAPAASPGDEMAWMLAGDEDGDDDAEAADDAVAGGKVEKRVVIRHMGGPGGPGGPGGEGEEGEDGDAPMMRMHRMGGMPGMQGMHGAPGMAGMRGMGGMRGFGHGGPGGGMRMMHMQMMAEHLGLSDAQREKMRDIHERTQRGNIQARADIQIAQMDLHKLLREDHVDRGAVDAQIDKISRLRTEQAHARMAAMLDAREVLTPDQRAKAKEMRMHGPMGMGMGGEGHGMRGGDKGERGEKKEAKKPEVKSRW
jgi:Spy/CpxP family protein refolding chaperone